MIKLSVLAHINGLAARRAVLIRRIDEARANGEDGHALSCELVHVERDLVAQGIDID